MEEKFVKLFFNKIIILLLVFFNVFFNTSYSKKQESLFKTNKTEEPNHKPSSSDDNSKLFVGIIGGTMLPFITCYTTTSRGVVQCSIDSFPSMITGVMSAAIAQSPTDACIKAFIFSIPHTAQLLNNHKTQDALEDESADLTSKNANLTSKNADLKGRIAGLVNRNAKLTKKLKEASKDAGKERRGEKD